MGMLTVVVQGKSLEVEFLNNPPQDLARPQYHVRILLPQFIQMGTYVFLKNPDLSLTHGTRKRLSFRGVKIQNSATIS
jgi:hypothetical protein